MPRELFENVSGNSVYFSEFSSSITFATKSDALLACLLEKHDPGVWALADDLLELFRNAQFKPNAVTFKCAGDHSDRISQERRSLAQVRSTCNSQASLSSVPSAVVGLTASHIYSEASLPLDHPDIWSIEHETLKSMALVHRSWTDAVQAWLRRRLVICDISSLPGLLKSPLLGPWVHEFRCSFDTISNRPIRDRHHHYHHLCGILERCPNLTRFYFDSVDTVLSPTEYSFFDQLGRLNSLENLWLHGYYSGVYAYEDSERLWRALKKLPLLRSLSITGVFRADPDKRGILDNPSGGIVHLPPTLGFHITGTPFFLRCSEGTTLPTVTIAHVDMGVEEHMSAKRFAGLSSFLHRCPSLTVLVLRIYEAIDFRFLTLSLPGWIKSLHIHFGPSVVHPDIEDEVTMALLRSSPQLREMTISADSYAFLPEWDDSTEEDILPFTATQKFCEERDVKLHLFESDFEPSLIHYPWTPESHILDRTR